MWDTPAVANVVYALKPGEKRCYQFPNFMRIGIIAKIAQHDTRDNDFAHLTYISFLYALRVPPDAIPLRMPSQRDDLTGCALAMELALIGIR